MAALNLAFWRKWHRWIGFPAALFLLWAAATGVLVAFTEFFGEEEALREATRDLISPVTVSSAQTEWSEPIARAFATAATQSKGHRWTSWRCSSGSASHGHGLHR
jgi:uncharacterized iron-regulated membrane protein